MNIEKLKETIVGFNPITFEDATFNKMIIFEDSIGVMQIFTNDGILKFKKEYKDMRDLINEEFNGDTSKFNRTFSYCENNLRSKIREEFPSIDFIYTAEIFYNK